MAACARLVTAPKPACPPMRSTAGGLRPRPSVVGRADKLRLAQGLAAPAAAGGSGGRSGSATCAALPRGPLCTPDRQAKSFVAEEGPDQRHAALWACVLSTGIVVGAAFPGNSVGATIMKRYCATATVEQANVILGKVGEPTPNPVTYKDRLDRAPGLTQFSWNTDVTSITFPNRRGYTVCGNATVTDTTIGLPLERPALAASSAAVTRSFKNIDGTPFVPAGVTFKITVTTNGIPGKTYGNCKVAEPCPEDEVVYDDM